VTLPHLPILLYNGYVLRVTVCVICNVYCDIHCKETSPHKCCGLCLCQCIQPFFPHIATLEDMSMLMPRPGRHVLLWTYHATTRWPSWLNRMLKHMFSHPNVVCCYILTDIIANSAGLNRWTHVPYNNEDNITLNHFHSKKCLEQCPLQERDVQRNNNVNQENVKGDIYVDALLLSRKVPQSFRSLSTLLCMPHFHPNWCLHGHEDIPKNVNEKSLVDLKPTLCVHVVDDVDMPRKNLHGSMSFLPRSTSPFS